MPFIVAWAHPDAENKFQKAFPVAQNAIQTQMGTVMDIYPTVLSVAGVKVPENHILDGSTLERMIAGKKDKAHRDDFLMHFPHEHRGSYFTSYRKGDWKLIYYYNPEHPDAPYYKLFNLSEEHLAYFFAHRMNDPLGNTANDKERGSSFLQRGRQSDSCCYFSEYVEWYGTGVTDPL